MDEFGALPSCSSLPTSVSSFLHTTSSPLLLATFSISAGPLAFRCIRPAAMLQRGKAAIVRWLPLEIMSAPFPNPRAALAAFLLNPSALDIARAIGTVSCILWIPLWYALGLRAPPTSKSPSYTRSPTGERILAASPTVHSVLPLFVVFQFALLFRVWRYVQILCDCGTISLGVDAQDSVC